MDFIDYREALGIGICDNEKNKFLITKIFNELEIQIHSCSVSMNVSEYRNFCNGTGSVMDVSLISDYCGFERYKYCVKILHSKRNNMKEFLLYYIYFANSIEIHKFPGWKRNDYINLLCSSLKDAHIPYKVICENGSYFLFPEGAKELDVASFCTTCVAKRLFLHS